MNGIVVFVLCDLTRDERCNDEVVFFFKKRLSVMGCMPQVVIESTMLAVTVFVLGDIMLVVTDTISSLIVFF